MYFKKRTSGFAARCHSEPGRKQIEAEQASRPKVVGNTVVASQLSAPVRLLLKELAGPDLEHFGLLPGQLPDVKEVAATVSRQAWDALNEGTK